MTAYLVDTNLLLRSLEPDTPAGAQALKAIKTLLSRGDKVYLVPQVLYEFWVVCTRPAGARPTGGENGLGLSPEATAVELARIKTLFPIMEDNERILSQWIDLVTRYRVIGRPAHDARLVAAMLVHGITHLLTNNGDHFTRYPEIIVVAPVDVSP